jgi:hypothetical protein
MDKSREYKRIKKYQMARFFQDTLFHMFVTGVDNGESDVLGLTTQSP